MPHFNEYALELSIMELFQQEGYIYTNGEEVHKEVSDVLLRDDMRLYLRNRYKAESITPLEIERVLAKLTANVSFSLYEQNRHTYRLMTEGFSLKREDAALPDLFIEPIDFSKDDKYQSETDGTAAENRYHGVQEGKQNERRGLLQASECVGEQIQ